MGRFFPCETAMDSNVSKQQAGVTGAGIAVADMGIYLRGLWRIVPQQYLNATQVGAILKQMGSERMP